MPEERLTAHTEYVTCLDYLKKDMENLDVLYHYIYMLIYIILVIGI